MTTQLAPRTRPAQRAATSETIELDPSPYQRRVFGDRLHEQARRASALLNQGSRTDSDFDWRMSQRAKLVNCCRQAQVCGSMETGDVGMAEQCCKSRVCVRCSRKRALRHTARAATCISAMDSPRLITLTMQHSHLPLVAQLSFLRNYFKLLRATATWRARVTGGFYTIEMTYNREREEWHPHIHAVVDGSYFPEQLLRDTWCAITNGSKVVDVSKVNSARAAARYMAQYIAKSSDVDHLPESKIPDWARAVAAARMIAAFGTSRGVKFELPPRSRPQDWEQYANANTLARAAQQGDGTADQLLAEIERHDRGPVALECPGLGIREQEYGRALLRDVESLALSIQRAELMQQRLGTRAVERAITGLFDEVRHPSG